MKRVISVVFATLLLAIIAFLAHGCYSQIKKADCDSTTISVFCDDASTVNLEKQKAIPLSTSEPLGQIEHVEFLRNLILIHASGKLTAFDLASGDSLCQYSRKGRSQKEYISLWAFNVYGEKVMLYDLSGGKIMVYSQDGIWDKNIDLKREQPTFQAFAQLDEDLTIGKRRYEGMETIELSLWDKEFNYVGDLESGQTIHSGIMLTYPFAKTIEGNVLYTRYFQNEIYELSPERIHLKYSIDFGTRTLKQLHDVKDEYEALELFNQSHHKASFISNVYEDKESVAFFFLMSPEGAAYAVYNKAQNKASVYRFHSEEEIAHVSTHKNECFVITQNIKGESFLYRIPLGWFPKETI